MTTVGDTPGDVPHKVIERLALVAPLGMRFWDGVTNEFVGSGLVVTAYPVGQEWRKVEATVNRAAVYGFVSLPGLRELEGGEGDAQYWANLPFTRPFRIEVVDRERRFLPAVFTVNAPAQGAATLWCGSPLSPLELPSSLSSPLAGFVGGIPLFSASSRLVPAGMAVMRGQLWDGVANRAAAWALVEASPLGQRPVYGVADERGMLTLIFPTPKPQRPPLFSPLNSPIGPPPAPLWLESWTIPLAAFYGALAAPELCEILAQPPATLWASQSPNVELVEATLRYGEESILRSAGADPSSLLITTS